MADWKLLLLLMAVMPLALMAPVDPNKVREDADNEDGDEDDDEKLEDEDTGLEYDRYLKEVINILEKDPDFKKKLESADINDIKSGKIAEELNLVNHQVRSKLDELKRQEVNRLRIVAREQMERENGVRRMDKGAFDELLGHVDVRNPKSFEEEDLSKLIQKATRDLDDMDKQRRDQFKKYEMEKEVHRREKLKQMSDAKREAAKKEWEEMNNKKKQHPKINHPGSKKQLEEVWEETDNLDPEDFNPKTFFRLHDKNGDGKLDPLELEALFVNELEKIYGKDSDPREQMEEMSRMREHVLTEVDKDGDFMIDLKEFLTATQSKDFETDESWEDIADQELYTEEELAEYQRELEEMEAKRARSLARKQQMAKERQQKQQQQQQGIPPEKLQEFNQQQAAADAEAQQKQQLKLQEVQQQQQQKEAARQAAAQQDAARQAAAQQDAARQAAAQQEAARQAAAQQAAAQQQQQQDQREQMKLQFDEAQQALQQQKQQQQFNQAGQENIVQMDQGQQVNAQLAQQGQGQPPVPPQ